MPPICVLILGRSFIRHVKDFHCRNFNAHIAKNLSLDGNLLIKWHGIGSRTVSKTTEYDLGVVEEFAPNVVLIQLGTNDLTTILAVQTGSGIEDLCHLLYESYGAELICVCQTLYRKDASSFNKRVDLLTKYLKVVLEPIPNVFYWHHRGFWRCKSRFLARDGVHLNKMGHYKDFRSLRGPVLKCIRIFSGR